VGDGGAEGVLETQPGCHTGDLQRATNRSLRGNYPQIDPTGVGVVGGLDERREP
jgi:hypothetical protein